MNPTGKTMKDHHGKKPNSIWTISQWLLLILLLPVSITARDSVTHLAGQHSPYLLQHVDNLIEWYPWGREAFDRARRENKPVFVSIGYSSCHWCHVMEEESFRNPTVARFMNASFINILVDREERPDLDAIYMRACMLMDQSCGWPLNVFMTADRKPFFVTTYLPPTGQSGRIGLLELARKIMNLWLSRRDDLALDAERVARGLSALERLVRGDIPDRQTLDRAFQQLQKSFNKTYGGFGTAPKFPQPHSYLFLLRYYLRTGEPDALRMVRLSLDAMLWGGLYDHLEGGFFRYATDPQWRIPHFEKMLADQAWLVLAYTEAYQVTHNPAYRRVVEETLAFLDATFRSPDGAYYTSTDADSEGKEGRYYVWTADQFDAALPPPLRKFARIMFDITSHGNLASPEYPEGVNTLYFTAPPNALIKQLHMEPKEFWSRYEQVRQLLRRARGTRPKPALDLKILTDWNGLTMAALAYAGRALGHHAYIERAVQVEQFLRQHLRDREGRLYHRFYRGHAGVPGLAQDYATVVFGLLHLYEATFDPVYLERAIGDQNRMDHIFLDPESGGYYENPPGRMRIKAFQDGARPSTNGLAFVNLLQLSRLTGNRVYRERALRIATAFGRSLQSTPTGHLFFLVGVDFLVGPTYEIVVTGDPRAAATRNILTRIARAYLPQSVLLFRHATDTSPLLKLAPFTRAQRPRDGKTTLYVCKEFVCKQPTTDVDEALSQIVLRWDKRGTK